MKGLQKRTIESREKIDKAAFELFMEKGYYNTNTKEIARVAGISVGNFYNYYKDKGDVYYVLMKKYVTGSGEALSMLAATMLQSENPRHTFNEYINQQIKRAGSVGRFFDDCHVLIKDDERLNTLFEENISQIVHEIEKMIQQMKGVQERGSYQVMARLLFTAINETTTDIVSCKGKDFFQEYIDQLALLMGNYLFGEEK